MRTSWLYPVLPVLACGLLVGCGTHTSDPPAVKVVVVPLPSTPAAAAQADAQSLLGLFEVPPGATRLAVAPKPLPGPLSLPNPEAAGTNTTRVLVTSWWSYSGTLKQATDWFAAHPPAGTTAGELGFSNGPSSETKYLSYDRKPTPQLAQRSLGISVLHVGGRTLLRVDAESVWIPARPADATIPAGVTRVVVTKDEPGSNGVVPKPVTLPAVTGSRSVAAIVSAFNGLSRPVPGQMTSCPQSTGGVLQFAFYQGSSKAPVATAATVVTGCGGVTLSVRGGAQGLDLNLSPALDQVVKQLPQPKPNP